MTPKKQGRGGNAHQRAVAQKANAANIRVDVPPPVVLSKTPQERSDGDGGDVPAPSLAERILRFAYSNVVLAILSIVGGLCGTFLDGRYFAVLALLIPGAVVRERVLERIRPRIAGVIASAVSIICAAGLYVIGIELNKFRVHTNTPGEYRKVLETSSPAPIANQITNIYRTVIQKEPKQAQFALGNPSYVGKGEIGDEYAFVAQNTGTGAAREVINTSISEVRPFSRETEDTMFRVLEGQSEVDSAPRMDIDPGTSVVMKTLAISGTPDPGASPPSNRTVRYFMTVIAYTNSDGKRLHKERCLLQVANGFQLCTGHNLTKTVPPAEVHRH